MRAFRLGLVLGANGIETDIRKTKDGILILFHDSTLQRLAERPESVSEFTYEELSGIPIPSPDGSTSDTIPRMTDLLDYIKSIPVFLALELKADGLESEVVRAIKTYGVKDRCIVTSFRFDYLKNVKLLDEQIPVGLLTDRVDDEILSELRGIGAEQICPKAELLTPDLVHSLHDAGLSVRAWGVRDETLMQLALECGVDGMTVNFPDKLQSYLSQTGTKAMTQQERMIRGLLYDPSDPAIMNEQAAYLERLWEFNRLKPIQMEEKQRYMQETFAACGEDCYIELPFHANWGGGHVHFGNAVYANFNLTMVDDGHIYVGDCVLFGPNVTVATANHPIWPELRRRALQYNKDVHIGNNVWIGANSVICPGVCIGDNTVIGAGSVVTKDIPENVVAVGNPCRVMRPISERDRNYFYRDEAIDWINWQEACQQQQADKENAK